MPNPPLTSIQLYSLRSMFEAELSGYNQLCERLAAIGYRAIEGFHYLPKNHLPEDIAALKAIFDEHRVWMRSSHVPLDALRTNMAATLATYRQLNTEDLIVPYLTPEERPQSAAEWESFAQELEALAQEVASEGFKLHYHNHEFELAFFRGHSALDILMEYAPNLGLELDIGWLARDGANILSYLERHQERISYLHIKDIAPKGEKQDEDGWAIPGEGSVDWQGLGPQLDKLPLKAFVVEHDKPKAPLDFAERALGFVSGGGLGV